MHFAYRAPTILSISATSDHRRTSPRSAFIGVLRIVKELQAAVIARPQDKLRWLALRPDSHRASDGDEPLAAVDETHCSEPTSAARQVDPGIPNRNNRRVLPGIDGQ